MTKAHCETQHLTLHYEYPEHEPRSNDSHYHYFNEARQRLQAAGKLTCWINNADCAGGIELHHAQVEFALANDIDIPKFAQLYPEFAITCDEDFFRVIESEGCLTALCVQHHRGLLGIHTIHYPAWVVQRALKAGVSAPERKVQTSQVKTS